MKTVWYAEVSTHCGIWQVGEKMPIPIATVCYDDKEVMMQIVTDHRKAQRFDEMKDVLKEVIMQMDHGVDDKWWNDFRESAIKAVGGEGE